jgi:hypothetical protein
MMGKKLLFLSIAKFLFPCMAGGGSSMFIKEGGIYDGEEIVIHEQC